jgi:hypothetical protein
VVTAHIHVPPQWPGAMSDEARAVANEILNVLAPYETDVIGPVLSTLFGFMVMSFGKHDDDKLDEIMRDVTSILLKFGAAERSH